MTIATVSVLVLIAWYAGWFGNALVNHGKIYTIKLPSLIASFVVTLTCLYLGGFFIAWNWPQFTYLILTSVGLGMIISSGNKIENKHNVITSFLSYAFIWFLYYKGGLFLCFNN